MSARKDNGALRRDRYRAEHERHVKVLERIGVLQARRAAGVRSVQPTRQRPQRGQR